MRRLLLAACAATQLLAAADTVLVVVNDNSAVSRSIAEYYAIKRSIPLANLCHIRTPEQEVIARDLYVRTIEAPIAGCLRSKGLTEKVLYIVTTAGLPLRIQGSEGSPDAETAAVDSELTLLYSRMRGQKFPLKGHVPNPFYRKTSAVFRHPDFPIYLVCRLAAFDFGGVRAIIDRSLAAKNTGRFILDARGDTNEGDEWLKDAAIRLPTDRTLFEDTRRVVYGEKNVIGFASWGSNDKNRHERHVGFQWLPGAIMTEFVSTNARTFAKPPPTWNIGPWSNQAGYFAGAPQTLITDYLEEGATGAAGHVSEPYLVLNPRPDVLLPAYYSGRNLAESYYLSIPGLSWQNVVVGDPLCSLGPPAGKK